MNKYDDVDEGKILDPANDAPANKYDEVDEAAILDGEPSNSPGFAMRGAVGVNPDDHVATLALSREVNLPSAVVARNKANIQNQHALQQFDFELMKEETPILSRWLSNPDNASIAHDDINNLSAAERAMITPPGIIDAITTNTGAEKVERAELTSKMLWGGGLSEQENTRYTELEEIISNDTRYQTGFNSAVHVAADMVEMNLASMADAFKTRGAPAAAFGAGLGVLSPVPGSVPAFAAIGGKVGTVAGYVENTWQQTFDEAYQDLTSDGISPEAAKWGALLVSIPSTALEMAVVGKAIKLIPGAGNLLGGSVRSAIKKAMHNPTVAEKLTRIAKDYVQVVAGESAQEGTQSMMSSIAREVIEFYQSDGESDYTSDELFTDLDKAWDESFMAMKGTALLGIFGAGAKTAQVALEKTESASNIEQGKIDGLFEALDGSALANRSSQDLATVINDVASANDSPNVYMDGKAVANLFQGEDSVDLAGLENKTMAAIKAQLPEAVAVGGDIVIPTGDFAADFAINPDLEVLRPHLRLSESTLAPAEVKQAREDTRNQIEQLSKQAEINAAETEYLENWSNNLAAELVATKKYAPDVAKDMAKVMRMQAVAMTAAGDEFNTVEEFLNYQGLAGVQGETTNINPEQTLSQAAEAGYEGQDAAEAQEWVAANEAGMDLSIDARMERALQMGFNLERRLYHGTTHDIENIDVNAGNVESAFGKAFYTTTSTHDASENYAKSQNTHGERGPDLDSRVEFEWEQFESNTEENVYLVAEHFDVSDEDVTEEQMREYFEKEIASTLDGGQANVIEGFARIENPLILEGDNATEFTYEQEYDEETDEYGEESGTIIDLLEAIDYQAGRFSEEVKQHLLEQIGDDMFDGVSASDVFDALKEGPLSEEYGDNGMEGVDIIKNIFAEMGFDAIETDASQRFSNMEMEPGTTHVMLLKDDMFRATTAAFDPAQKSSSNILAQPAARKPNTKAGKFPAHQDASGFLVVFGDPVEIREKIPHGLRGTPVLNGLRFTPNLAPRAAAALRGEETSFSRAGKVVRAVKNKDGKYRGASEANNTEWKRRTWRKKFEQLAKEGEDGRFWYENSGAAVLDMVGGDVAEAKKFVALLAIYSPQAKVDANATFALRAWAQYKDGQPISVKTGSQDGQATGVLYDNKPWGGEKTNNFYINLLREIDPAVKAKQGATIDMWMMRAGFYDHDAPNGSEYRFMENETNRLAAQLGWEPQQVQAAVWVGMKARMENKQVKKDTEATSEKAGWIHYNKNAKGKDVRVVDDASKHMSNWVQRGMDHELTDEDTNQAKFDFSDGVTRHTGQVSWEARPSVTSGVLHGIHAAPYKQQMEFQRAIQNALSDENGVDLLAQHLGILSDGSVNAPGVWEGAISPSTQEKLSMAPAQAGVMYHHKDGSQINKRQWQDLTKDDKKFYTAVPAIDPAQRDLLDTYAAVMGLMLKQDGVGYHKPFYGNSLVRSNGVSLDIGRPLVRAEAQAFNDAFDSLMAENGTPEWSKSVGLVSSPQGIRVVSFDQGLLANKAMHGIVKEAFSAAIDEDAQVNYFVSDGDLIGNDWEASPNGQDYKRTISASRSPDVLEWSGNVLYPEVRAVFKEFSEKYGWGDPGKADYGTEDREVAQKVAQLRASPQVLGQSAQPPSSQRDTVYQSLLDAGFQENDEGAANPEWIISKDDSYTESSYITLQKVLDWDAEYGALETKEYSLRFSTHELPAKYERGKTVYQYGPMDNIEGYDGAGAAEAIDRVRSLTGRDINDVLAQPGDSDNRGQIEFLDIDHTKAIISIFSSADESTFLHEAGHLFFNTLERLTKDGKATQQQQADWATMLDFVEAQPGDVLTREQLEKIASAWESYLYSGRSASIELMGLMRRISAWMTRIYKSLKHEHLDVGVTEPVREVMDRMLASQEQIDLVKSDRMGQLLYATAEEAGMTDAEFEAYQASAADSTSKAQESLQAKLLSQLKRQTTKWWKEEKSATRADVEEDVNSRPVFRAESYMRDGKLVSEDGPTKVSTESLKELYPEGIPSRLKGLHKKGGVEPDAIANGFGYTGGKDMLDAIVKSPTRNDLINDQVEQRMIAKHGDILNDGTLEKEAEAMSQNEERGKTLLIELRALAKQSGKGPTDSAILKALAEAKIGELSLKQLKPYIYRKAEIKAAQEASVSKDNGDHAGAHEAKLRQVFNYHMWRAADEAQKKVASIRKKHQMIKNKTYSRGKYAQEYIGQAKMLLSAYDFRVQNKESELEAKVRLEGVRNWLKGQNERDFTNSLLIEADILQRLVPYDLMTVQDLKGLDDVVQSIMHGARMEADEAKARWNADRDQGVESLENNRINIHEYSQDKTPWAQMKSGIGSFAASLRKFESLVKQADGMQDQGWLWRHTVKPLLDSLNKKIVMREKAHEALDQIFKGHEGIFNSLKDRREYTLESGAKTTLSLGARVSLALNIGNEYNREMLAQQEKTPMTEADISMITADLTDSQWDLVQNVWDYIGTYWAESAEIEKQRTGVAPARVEAVPFQTQSGKQMRGGYYPMAADPEGSILKQKHSADERAKQMRSGGSGHAATQHGSMKARTNFANQQVRLSINVLFEHVEERIHDISHWKGVNEVDRILNDRDIQSEIATSLGMEGYQALVNRLTEVAGGQGHAKDLTVAEKALRHARLATTYAALGFSIRTAVVNVLGLNTAISDMSASQVTAAAAEYYTNKGALDQFIEERSPFMVTRGQYLNRDIAAIRGKLKGKTKMSGIQNAAFWFMGATDRAITRPIWMAAYHEGETLFNNEQAAIDHADRMVARTQGTGFDMDLAGMENRNEFVRAFTVMYTAFSAIYNTNVDQVNKLKAGKISMATFINKMMWGIVASGLMEEFMIGDDDEDDDVTDTASRYGMAVASYGLGMVPFLRDWGSILKYGQSFPSPVASLLEAPSNFATQAEQGELDRALLRSFGDLAAIFHIPGGAQLSRTGGYLLDLENIDDPSVYDALMTGREDKDGWDF